MEDHTQSKTQSAKADKENIVDLTSDMELPDQTKHRIIDLTDDMDSGEDQKDKLPTEDVQSMDTAPAPAAVSEETASLKTDELEVEEPSAVEDIDLTGDMDSGEDQEDERPSEDARSMDAAPAPAAVSEETASLKTDELEVEEPSAIEDEVDAAFDAVQADPDEPVEEDIIFEKLTNITEEVDNAVRQMHDSGSAQKTGDEEEIIELTDIVTSTDAAATEAVEKTDDNDIIDLVDKVTPEELEASRITDTDDDDEIIELTDIVDPGELAAGDVSSPLEDESTTPEVPSETESAELEEVEETLDLSASDLFEPDDSIVEEPTGKKEEFEIDEIDALFGDDAALAGEPNEASEPTPGSGIEVAEDIDPEKNHHEQIIQLSDVLSTTVKEDKPPIEQVKMGAEEDIANQHISVEEEETANALGMDLSGGPEEEQHLLSNKEIERTVRHILQTQYADTIEQMIASAVEKAVTREIEKIKLSLSDDEPPA